MTSLSPEAVSAIAAGAGALLVKIVEKVLTHKDRAIVEEHAEHLRTELRKEVERLREEVTRAHKSSDKWQKKYWEATANTDFDEHKIETLVSNISILQKRIDDIESDDS